MTGLLRRLTVRLSRAGYTGRADEIGEAGAGGVTVDNLVDAPAEATTLIASGADLSTPGEATLRGKDFYAQDTDPGAVGTGSVWKDTTNPALETWWLRNATNDGWGAAIEPFANGPGDSEAFARMRAYTTGDGGAYSGPIATTEGAGNADTRPTATSGGAALGAAFTGSAIAGSVASSDDGAANVQGTATTSGEGDATAGSSAAANGTGAAIVEASATAVSGRAQVSFIATSNSISAGFYAEVDTDVPKLGFNAVAVAQGVPIPVVPLTAPDVQDVIDALVALGLITQSD